MSEDKIKADLLMFALRAKKVVELEDMLREARNPKVEFNHDHEVMAKAAIDKTNRLLDRALYELRLLTVPLRNNDLSMHTLLQEGYRKPSDDE